MLYFNYAGLSPTNPQVIRAMHDAADTFNALLYSESGIACYRKQVKECRKSIAALLRVHSGQDGHSLTLCPNATLSLRIALSMIGLQSGDLVITSDQEHLSTLHALSGLTQRGIAVQVIPAMTEEQFVTQLEDACKLKTAKLVLLSHVSHFDGRIFPVERICEITRKRNILLALDGAQAAGHVPVNIGTIPADFYYFSGHKWCAGPMGSGALLVSRQYQNSRASKQADCREEGEDSEDAPDLGTQNISLIAGLATACALKQQEWAAMAPLAGLRRLVSERLGKIRDVEIAGWDRAHAPGILSLRVRRPGFDPARIATYLSQRYEIALKPIQYRSVPPLLRISWSHSTSDQDVVFLAEKLEEALERCTARSTE
ncbi:MAG TPA: aminotransferase class V-fold PLP-dependent enzyme [Nitrospiraceae bacterium]|nr:aminotransferase class V-fold PLP-dependent enzyme [Nitrospiraceae bacterium]